MSRPDGGSELVAINGRAVVRRQIGGVERYAINLARELRRLRPSRYRLICPPPQLAHRSGHLWEQAVLPALARRCALIYSAANLGPVASRRGVLVLHDVAALANPSAYSETYVRYQRALLPVLARRARLVITVSGFSRSEIIERLGLEPEKIAIVPGGVDERFSPGADAAGAARALGIGSAYVLCVGTDSSRKNLQALEPAARALHARGLELVVAGSARAYLRGGGTAGVRRLGYVDDALLPGLYAGARALVMPSRHEGFGLPCLEAMACGVPVVAADAAALPETCGDAALLVDPADPAAMAEAVLSVLTEGSERDELIRAGLERARGFSWAESARATDCLISGLLGTRTASRA